MATSVMHNVLVLHELCHAVVAYALSPSYNPDIPRREQPGPGQYIPTSSGMPAAIDTSVALYLQGQSTKAQDPGAWATGIVEVALPVEYKMKNIEETEGAKRRLLHASRSAAHACCQRFLMQF